MEEYSKTFEQAYLDMQDAYSNALALFEPIDADNRNPTYEEAVEIADAEDDLYQKCHQVLHNCLYLLNDKMGEDEVWVKIDECPEAHILGGVVLEVCGIMSTGEVWFNMDDGTPRGDDEVYVYHLVCICDLLYKMTK